MFSNKLKNSVANEISTKGQPIRNSDKPSEKTDTVLKSDFKNLFSLFKND